MNIMDIAFTNFEILSDTERSQLELSRKAPGTLVVRGTMEAVNTATCVDSCGIELVLAVDKEDNLAGVVIPRAVRKRLQDNRGISGDNFRDVMEKYISAPQELARPLQERWRHEWLNLDRPDFYWCAKGGHFVSQVSCPYHS